MVDGDAAGDEGGREVEEDGGGSQHGSKTRVLFLKGMGLCCVGPKIGPGFFLGLDLELDFSYLYWIRLVLNGNKPKDLFCKI